MRYSFITTAAITATGVIASSPLEARAATLPSGFTYDGCYTDDYPTLRILGGAYHVGSDVSTEQCINYCVSEGYTVAGTEYGNECYCGNFVDTDLVSYGIPSSSCNYACAGNANEICGGDSGVSIYTAGNLRFSSVTVNTAKPPPAGYSIVGCYRDNYPTGRTLTGASLVNQPQMTTEKCTAYCTAQGFKYSGTEYSRECFCGNTINTDGSTYGIISNQCNTPCTGDAQEICGGSNHAYIYQQIAASSSTTSSTTTTRASTTSSTAATTTTTTRASTTTSTTTTTSAAAAPTGPAVGSTITSCPVPVTYITSDNGARFSVCPGSDYNFPSPDIYYGVASVQACSTLCENNSACTRASYNPSTQTCYNKGTSSPTANWVYQPAFSTIQLVSPPATGSSITSCPSPVTYIAGDNGALFSVCTGSDYNFPSPDIYYGIASVQACSTLCENNSACTRASYNPSTQTCYNKGTSSPTANWVYQPAFSTIQLIPDGTPITQCPSALISMTASDGSAYTVCRKTDYNLPSPDIWYSVASSQACINQCEATSTCKKASYNAGTKTCYNKSNTQNWVINSKFLSIQKS